MIDQTAATEGSIYSSDNKMIEKFEEELTRENAINPSNIYDMIFSLIEDRVNLERYWIYMNFETLWDENKEYSLTSKQIFI